MDFFDLLFGGGQAIQGIFRLGFIPKEEDFREFSGEEYQKFKEKECDICGKMYTFKSGGCQHIRRYGTYPTLQNYKVPLTIIFISASFSKNSFNLKVVDLTISSLTPPPSVTKLVYSNSSFP